MTLVPSHPQPSNGNNLLVKKFRLLIIFFMAFVCLALQAQQNPESFISHKVKKRETILDLKMFKKEPREIKFKIINKIVKNRTTSYYPPRSQKVLNLMLLTSKTVTRPD